MRSKFINVAPVLLVLGFGLICQASPPAGYYEVWGDEFAGSSLNTGNWGYWLYPGNYKDATLSQSAVSESGNHVVITTYTSGGTDYTAMLSTQGKFHACYGYFEANIQWSDNTGMWSAFWLQSPLMGEYIGDPYVAGAEIDICEHRLEDGSGDNINNDVQSNIHWNGYGSSESSAGSGNYSDSSGDLGSGFHKYGLLWTSSGYALYVNDGQQVWSTSSGLSGRTEFIVLSSIVDDTDTTWAGTIPSGGYGSLSSSTTKLAVDYVRYYAPTNSIFWTGASSSSWFDPSNWIANATAPASGNDAVFSLLSTGNFTTTLDQDLTLNSLSIWECSPVTINSNTLTINSSLDMNSAWNNATINSAIVLGDANYWTVGPGVTLYAQGPISGGHSLHLEGLGTVALSNTNSYTLGTYVDDGTLQLLNGNALGTTNVGVSVANGATLQVYANLTCNQPLTLNGTAPALRVSAAANAVWSGPTTLANAATIQLDGGTSLAIDNSISGAHTLYLAGDGGSQGVMNGPINTGASAVNKSGAGTWTLAGTNTFTGALNVDSASTTANDGILVITSSNAAGSASSIQILDNNSASSTLQLNGSQGDFAVAQPISLSGRYGSAPAIENVEGSNTLAGPITINVGGSVYEVQSDSGTLTLSGGIESAASGTRTFTFQGSGGILVSGAISNGSATTFNVAQTGPGSLTLAASNTYNGSTMVNGGTMALGPSGWIGNSTNLSVTNGATLDVSQAGGGFVLGSSQMLSGNGIVTGAVSCASGAVISPGGGVSECTLSLSNNLTLSGGAACAFDLSNFDVEGSGTNDEILVAGNLILSGTNTLAINPMVGLLANGRYVLMRYGGILTGGAANFAVVFTGVPPEAALTVDTSVPGQIGLVVSAFPGNLVWRGDGAANVWDSGVSSNWFNGTGRTPFYPGDSVTFDNTATNPTVTLSGTLSPGLITISGSSNYTLTGSGKISGITGLISSNTGTLTVLTTNTYSGATEINAGTVQVGNGTVGGALGFGSTINNGALVYNHPDVETNGGAISGVGTLTQTGSGTLVLNGNNSFSGGTTLSQGFIDANTSTALGTGPITINNSATQLVCAAGITLTNSLSINPGASSGLFASGIVRGPASGTATLAGPMTITALTGSGGHFDGGNSSGGLVITGPITASSPVRHRANRVTFAGGGAYTFFWSEGTTVLGATNGLSPNAVADLGYSGSAGTLDLAGYNQTLNGLLKGSQTATVGNSSTVSDSMLTISGATSNTTYAGTIQDSINGGTHKTWLTVAGDTFTLSAANTFSGNTELTGGTLVLASASALQDSPLNLAAGDSGVLSFGSLTSATLGGLLGSRTLGLTNSSGAAVALTVGDGNTNTYVYSGSLTGAGSVTKMSAGTWVLNGTNTFTGAFYLDTAQPSSGNDGAVELASPGALNGASSIDIRNENAAYSTLQLDGSAGSITLNKPVSWNGRNNSVAAVENLEGSNFWSPGSVTLGVGGDMYTFQSDSGTLAITTTFPALGAVGSSSSSLRILSFQGNGNIVVSGAIQNANSTNGVVYVTQNGPGVLTLAGANTYTGGTTNYGGTLLVNGSVGTGITVTGGMLGGGGVIRGPVTVQTAGTLSPGAVRGVTSLLTVSNSLSLSGTTFLALNPSAGTNDVVAGLASVTYGGTLLLTNLSGAYSSNNTFKIFSAAAYAGAFTNITPLIPAPGLAWNTNTLAADGTLRLLQTVSLVPANLSFGVGSNQLTLSWPTDHVGWVLQAQTNTVLGTNWVNVAGSTATNSMTFGIDPSQGAVFYRIIFAN
jgi:autotransporter-associated beta strand protein